MTELEMYWWNPRPNFGDALNPIIVEKVFGIRPVWADLGAAALFGVGSILQLLSQETRRNGSATHEINVWGSGYIYDAEPPIDSPRVNYHAVRGKHTQAFGNIREDVVLGDPGILSPLLLEEPVPKRHEVGIVPHYLNQDDDEILKVKEQQPHVKIINVEEGPLDVVKQIASCDFIFSSSLHGLIVADSFGIPNQWARFDRPSKGDGWKFRDYYSAFDIVPPEEVQFNVSHTTSKVVGHFACSYVGRPGLDEMQNSLINAFPFRP